MGQIRPPRGRPGASILDIDLDYFSLFADPEGELDRLLAWASRDVDIVVEQHHQAFRRWTELVRRRAIGAPRHILHADEHHDMLGDRRPVGFGNFLYFAVHRWRSCRVHWLVKEPIDRPDMWLSERAWEKVAGRFTMGPHIPRGWPKPDLLSVCISPEFVGAGLRRTLVRRLSGPRYHISKKLLRPRRGTDSSRAAASGIGPRT